MKIRNHFTLRGLEEFAQLEESGNQVNALVDNHHTIEGKFGRMFTDLEPAVLCDNDLIALPK